MLNNFAFDSMSINPHRVSPVEITGKLNLTEPHSSFSPFRISHLSQSDGLVLCVFVNDVDANRLMVVNPCTGQTKWIQPRKSEKIGFIYRYALGSYQDSKSGNHSYKILSHTSYGVPEFEIYEINSHLRRILDVTMDCNILYGRRNVSLKGKSYWLAQDGKEKQPDLCLISFDYTTESFECRRLPYQYHGYRNMFLSVVREEKLSMLLQPKFTSKTEIWVTNKIGETKALSWTKVLAVDLKFEINFGGKFLVDEEKKVLMFTQYRDYRGPHMFYIVGEDNIVRAVAFENEREPFLFYYVPSLTQIQQGDDD